MTIPACAKGLKARPLPYDSHQFDAGASSGSQVAYRNEGALGEGMSDGGAT